jgi:5-methylthioadenosine/S-adenosylhomocysteine deaminase
MSVLMRGAAVLTVNDDFAILNEADVVVDGQTFTYVGPVKEWDREYDRIIDGSGKMIAPGFVNAHGHAAMTLLRSYADDVPLMFWLEKRIWPVEVRLKREDVYWGTMLAILEMLKTGTTTFTDMYFFMDQVAEAVAESGIRAVLSRGLAGISDQAEKGLEESEQFVRNWQGKAQRRITTMLGPHAPYTCPPDYLRRVMELQGRLSVPVQIHLSETLDEVERIKNTYGVSPTQLLKDTGLFSLPVLAAHCVHLSGEDMDILRDHNVHVAHNPGSNLKLGSGIAPVPDLLARGITVGLGTDGAASNNNLDMMEEVRLAALIHKGSRLDPTVITAPEALAMATRESARAVFLPDVGVIAEGMKADLVMYNLNRPNLTPRHNLAAHLVYAAQPGDISLVMVDGRVLVENGQTTTLDEEKIIFQAQQRAVHLVSGAAGKE